MTNTRRLLITLCTPLFVVAFFAAAVAAQTPQTQTPQTTTSTGTPTVTTEQMSGEVMQVNGNNLVVKMANGELRTFNNIPDTRKAMIDGKEVGVRDLKPGTKLTATITRTMTPVTVRTIATITGRVWVASGSNVVLTLPSGENKQYSVKPDTQFVVNGQPANVNDLRAGMNVTAQRVIEEPSTSIAVNTQITGQAPAAAR
jgi:hypothetical protein